MDDLHDRCQRLQSLLQSIDPSIDVEDLVGGSLPSTTRYGHDRKQSAGAESSGVATPEEGDHDSDGEEDMNQCKFEWYEGDPTDTGAVLADGMAGLNIDSKEVGYLGQCPNLSEYSQSWERGLIAVAHIQEGHLPQHC
jgi:transcriptional regulatory protein GAL4